eukprot:scaffold2381_cov128-Cylindrotheca_fusiformis.AAC.4
MKLRSQGLSNSSRNRKGLPDEGMALACVRWKKTGMSRLPLDALVDCAVRALAIGVVSLNEVSSTSTFTDGFHKLLELRSPCVAVHELGNGISDMVSATSYIWSIEACDNYNCGCSLEKGTGGVQCALVLP